MQNLSPLHFSRRHPVQYFTVDSTYEGTRSVSLRMYFHHSCGRMKFSVPEMQPGRELCQTVQRLSDFHRADAVSAIRFPFFTCAESCEPLDSVNNNPVAIANCGKDSSLVVEIVVYAEIIAISLFYGLIPHIRLSLLYGRSSAPFTPCSIVNTMRIFFGLLGLDLSLEA